MTKNTIRNYRSLMRKLWLRIEPSATSRRNGTETRDPFTGYLACGPVYQFIRQRPGFSFFLCPRAMAKSVPTESLNFSAKSL